MNHFTPKRYTQDPALKADLRAALTRMAVKEGTSFRTKLFETVNGEKIWMEATREDEQSNGWDVTTYRVVPDLESGEVLEDELLWDGVCLADALAVCGTFEHYATNLMGAVAQDRLAKNYLGETGPHFKKFAQSNGIPLYPEGNPIAVNAQGRVLRDNPGPLPATARKIAVKAKGRVYMVQQDIAAMPQYRPPRRQRPAALPARLDQDVSPKAETSSPLVQSLAQGQDIMSEFKTVRGQALATKARWQKIHSALQASEKYNMPNFSEGLKMLPVSAPFAALSYGIFASGYAAPGVLSFGLGFPLLIGGILSGTAAAVLFFAASGMFLFDEKASLFPDRQARKKIKSLYAWAQALEQNDPRQAQEAYNMAWALDMSYHALKLSMRYEQAANLNSAGWWNRWRFNKALADFNQAAQRCGLNDNQRTALEEKLKNTGSEKLKEIFDTVMKALNRKVTKIDAMVNNARTPDDLRKIPRVRAPDFFKALPKPEGT